MIILKQRTMPLAPAKSLPQHHAPPPPPWGLGPAWDDDVVHVSDPLRALSRSGAAVGFLSAPSAVFLRIMLFYTILYYTILTVSNDI